jgi:hypothetical protein
MDPGHDRDGMLADFSALCIWATLWGLAASFAAGAFVLLIA